MEEIPCRDCLVLAACKHKTVIECEALYKWLESGKMSHEKVLMCFGSWRTFYLMSPTLAGGKYKVRVL